MKLRNVLMIAAAVVAGLSLLLAGREVAHRYSSGGDPWELAFAALSNPVTRPGL